MIKSKDIQAFICKHWLINFHCDYVLSNFTGAGFEEMDVMTVTKAGLITEFEIKVSRSDFFNDFKSKPGKHAVLGKKDYEGHLNFLACKIPNYFYFAVPAGLVNSNEVPQYAGLIYFTKFQLRDNPGQEYVEYEIIKKAPKLHADKIEDKTIARIAKTLSQRLIFGCALMTYNNRKATQRKTGVV